MAQVTIITITTDSDPDTLGVMDGLNGEATMEKYLDTLQAALERAYPDATVQIEARPTVSGRIVVTYDDGSEIDTGFGGAQNDDTLRVEGLMNDVLAGKHGDYMVRA